MARTEVGEPGVPEHDVRALLEMAAQLDAPTLDTMTVAEGRAEFARRVARANPLAPDVPVEDLPGYRRYGTNPGAALLYFHGGGFVVGDLETVDPICRTLAARTGTTVLSVDYRRAPEAPFPAAVEDACAALEWAAARYQRLGVCGDSAGGTLAAVAAIHARDRGIALEVQMLVYPAVDQGGDYPSRQRYGEGFLLSRREIAWFGRHYFGADQPNLDWRASPIRAASLAGVAPAVVVTAGLDPLCDEGLAYADRLERDGVPVRSLCLRGTVHGCLNMGRYLASGRRVLDELCANWG